MLTEVRATSRQGSLLNMLLGEISSGIVLKEIDGLDPVKATIVSSSFPNSNGEVYLSSKREARDIKLRLSLDPDYISEEPRDVRNRLYQFFMPKTFVDLKFIDSNGLDVDISGMVESFEAPLFVQEPAADISIRCFDSDFVDNTVVSFNGNTVSNTLDSTIEYEGTVDTGMYFQLSVNRAIDEFTLYNTAPDGQLRQMDFSWPLLSGDVIKINSVQGDKYVKLTRAGVDISLLYATTPQSSWIDLQPGSNLFRAYATGAPIPYLITYYNRYGGL